MSIELTIPEIGKYEIMENHIKCDDKCDLSSLEKAGFIFSKNSSGCKIVMPEISSPRKIYFMATYLDVDSGFLLSNYGKMGPFIPLYNLYDGIRRKVPLFNKQDFLSNLEELKLVYYKTEGRSRSVEFDVPKLFNFTSIVSDETSSLIKNYLYIEGYLVEKRANSEDEEEYYKNILQEIYDEVHQAFYTYYQMIDTLLETNSCTSNESILEQEKLNMSIHNQTSLYNDSSGHFLVKGGAWIVDSTWLDQSEAYLPWNFEGGTYKINKTQALFTNLMDLLVFQEDEYAKVYAALHSDGDELKKVIKSSSIKDIVKGSYLSSVVKQKESSILNIAIYPTDADVFDEYSDTPERMFMYNRRYFLLISSILNKL